MQGQRIHELAASRTTLTPPLTWVCADLSLQNTDLKALLLETLPTGTGQPRVAVLDKVSTHRHGAMPSTGPEQPQAGIARQFLPPCSSLLHDIERTFRTCKHESLQLRSFVARVDLAWGVNQAFWTVHDRLFAQDPPRPDAQQMSEMLLPCPQVSIRQGPVMVGGEAAPREKQKPKA